MIDSSLHTHTHTYVKQRLRKCLLCSIQYNFINICSLACRSFSFKINLRCFGFLRTKWRTKKKIKTWIILLTSSSPMANKTNLERVFLLISISMMSSSYLKIDCLSTNVSLSKAQVRIITRKAFLPSVRKKIYSSRVRWFHTEFSHEMMNSIWWLLEQENKNSSILDFVWWEPVEGQYISGHDCFIQNIGGEKKTTTTTTNSLHGRIW